MIENKKLLVRKIFTTILSFAPLAVLAQTTFGVTNPISADDFPGLLKLIIDIVIKIGMPIVVLSIIYTGFLFIKAQGSPAGLKAAKEALIGTLIGAAIILGAYAISALIQGTVKSLQ